MLRTRQTGILLAMAILLMITGTGAAEAETNLNFVLGQKHLDSDDWPTGDAQGSLSFLSTFGSRSWPVQVAIDVLASGSTESSFEISRPGFEITGDDVAQGTFELDVGVRKIWRTGRARPFVGGGLAVIWGGQERARRVPDLPDLEIGDTIPLPPVIVSDSDEAPGAWIDGGIFWRLGKMFNIGLEVRYSRAELELFGEDVQTGGFNLGLILGWGWGGGARIVA
jgi:hypothetical protein